MSILLRRLLIITVLFGAGAAADPAIYIHPDASALERDAASELQRHLYAAGGALMRIEPARTVARDATGLVVGTADRLPDVGEAWPFGMEPPQHDGYVLHTAAKRLVVIAGVTPEGAQNGVYGLLTTLGYGFYLGGDTYPDTVPSFAKSQVPQFHESRSPAFAVRGSLPWYNFFDGPTAWELADHKAFIDQLVRMRCNFLGFHAYDSEPFAAYTWDGAVAGGEPLANTSKATWGTQPLPTDNFLAGTGGYFARPHFGASSSFIEDRAAAIRAAKDVLCDALRYAKRRGLKVCLGFEVTGDPTDAGVQARLEQRLRTLLDDYPMLDYVWLWQPEGLGLYPSESPKPRTLWDGYSQRWAAAFSGISEVERRDEAARWALFALQARQLLRALRPDAGLILSGWGGDDWLRCTDAFPGFDQVLPKDVTFSALDNIAVTPSVSAAYAELAPERSRWPILWFEYDGDQWFPQPNLRAAAAACRDALAKGCQGLLGIHWRTRAVEESAAYCAQFAWDTGLTMESFCRRRADDLFGTKAGEAMAEYLIRLQNLGYRWVGGAGQSECGRFSWSQGQEDKRAELETIARELRAELTQPKSLPAELVSDLPIPKKLVSNLARLNPLQRTTPRPDRRRHLEDLADEIEYVAAFDRAAGKFVTGGPFDQLVAAGDLDGAADLIREAGLPAALHTFARRMENKGELGVLATINAKAWADLRSRAGFDERTLASLEASPKHAKQAPRLIVLPDRVIVAGTPQDRLTAVLKARLPGDKRIVTRPLDLMGRTTFALAFPEELRSAQSIEYGIEVHSGRRTTLTWPGEFPNRWSSAAMIQTPAPAAPPPPETSPPAEPISVRHTVVPDRYVVQLTWDCCDGDMYTVARDGEVLGTVADGWFEDTVSRCRTKAAYRVESRRLLSGERAAGETMVTIPDLPLPRPPERIRVGTRANRIVLGWESTDPAAAQYFILKYDQDHRVIEETYIDADYGHYLQMSDQVSGGVPYTYTVAAVAPDGRAGPASKPVGIISSNEPLTPAVRLSFEDERHLAGLAQLADSALALGGRGWAELPPQPEWNPDHAISICVWVKLDDLEGMPVLVCKGAWQQSGYFLQILNGQIRFYLAGVDTLDAGHLQAGVWQHVVATFGFNQMRIYLNGEQVGRKRVVGRPRPSELPLLVGRYEVPEDEYFVRGLMDDIRIYLVPLTADEVAALYKETMRD